MITKLWTLKYRLKHWFFQWKQDDEGDIALVVANLLTLLKYKEHTIVKLNGYKLARAGKYQGKNECAQEN